jgi:NDP-sugar pyrophosphorylase family protein
MPDVKPLNIVVPMAGRGQRFADAGYRMPKPLIPVHGIPMIRLVIGNLTPNRPHRFIFLCQREHLEEQGLADALRRWAPGAAVIALDGITEGAACTVLLAEDLIDDEAPLMIANCDQWVSIAIDDYLAASDARGPDGELVDGLIMTMPADDPKWSFVGFDAAGRVDRVVEKQAISRTATVGIYNFAEGRRFVAGAKAMIAKDLRVNGEFYVAPVYNELIGDGARIAIHDIGAGMYGLGTPADLEAFLALPVSHDAVHRDGGLEPTA